MSRIANVSLIKDLGVQFCSQLTFKPHVYDVISRTTKLLGMAFRFISDIKSPILILKIVNTNITPVSEYCSLIWTQNRIMTERPLERALHQSTRIALQLHIEVTIHITSISTKEWTNLDYLTYEERR